MGIDRDLLFQGEVNIMKIGGVDIGSTLGGVTVAQDSTYAELTCDQILGISKKKLTDRRVRVTFNMAEMTLANIQKAMAQPATNLTGSTFYMSDDEQGTTYLEFEVDAPDGGGKWIYYFAIAYITGSGEHIYGKDTQTSWAVEVECVPDPDNSNQFGYIYAEAA